VGGVDLSEIDRSVVEVSDCNFKKNNTLVRILNETRLKFHRYEGLVKAPTHKRTKIYKTYCGKLTVDDFWLLISLSLLLSLPRDADKLDLLFLCDLRSKAVFTCIIKVNEIYALYSVHSEVL
jgi:hypothetical protein